MTSSIGTAWIEVRADLDKFSSDVASKASSLGSKFGSVTKSIAGVGIKAFAALGAAGIGVVGTGLKLASDMEQANVAFETMLGSGEKAKAFLDDLKTFAAQTPFEFPDLQDAASKLVAVGVNTEQVIPLMTALGDATSGMGTGSEGIQSAVRALTQMQQKGKVTGEEMLQLAEAGIPAWDALAASVGKSVPEVQAMVSKGEISVDQLMTAIETRQGESMQRLSGMMEKQSQTLSGLFSTLKDSVSMALADSAAPLAESLKDAIPKFSETLGDLVGTIGKAFGPVLATFVDMLAELMPVLTPVLEVVGGALADALKKLLPAIRPVAEAFGAVITALAPILPVIADVIAQVAIFAAELITQLVPVLMPLITALLPIFTDLFTQLSPVLMELAPPLLQLVDALVQLLVAILPILPPIIGVIGFLGKLAAVILGTVAKALAGIVSWIAGVISSFGQWWEFIKSLPGKIASAFGKIRDVIIDTIKAAINFVIKAWNAIDFSFHVDIPDWVPFVGGKSFGIDDIVPDIPMLAKGGIVSQSTLAVVGEAGPEAVIPLSQLSGMLGGRLEIVDWRRGLAQLSSELDYAAFARGE